MKLRGKPGVADHVFGVPGLDDEALSPIACCVPLELLAYEYAIHQGATMLGFNDPKRMEVNFRQIFASQIPADSDGA